MSSVYQFGKDAHSLSLDNGAQLVSWNRSQLKQGHSTGISASGIKHWLAICRKNVFWVEPHTGTDSFAQVPAACQMLLWQDDQKQFHVVIPLCDKDFQASISGEANGFRVYWEDGLENNNSPSARLLYTRNGPRAHALVKASMQDLSQILSTFQTREQKTTPAFVDMLGWCTWDAFYHDVDQRKVRRGLLSFRKGGVQLGHMILDDGAWTHSDEMLDSFEADREKFPNGIKAIAEMAKLEFGLQSFGIWHAFQGYWRGLNPKGELGSSYRTYANKGLIRPWEEDPKEISLNTISNDDIYRYYFDFYRYLRSQSVDMTKVDNQSALECFTQTKCGRVGSMRAYQEALQGAAAHFFEHNTLHCMSNGSDVGLNMLSSNVYRNSDDYFPKLGREAQQHHIFVNAFNATLSSTFSIPDWDMFQTHGPDPAFHAAARAISGGPIYVCDYPGKQDFKILKKLFVGNGISLRCREPALVCEDTLFTNVEQETKALKIYNKHIDIIILGLFHCYHGDTTIEARYRVSDHPDADQASYACINHRTQHLNIVKRNKKQCINLEQAEFDIITCAPIHDGVAVLGLLDKYNGSAAVETYGWTDDGFFCSLKAGSKSIGFYCKRKPKQVLVNGRSRSFTFKDGLVTVNSMSNTQIDILISL